jgi:hypothetical protein
VEPFTTLTDTKDAFLHLARRARQRLVIITPYIDPSGASWAADLFDATDAAYKTLVLRGPQTAMQLIARLCARRRPANRFGSS